MSTSTTPIGNRVPKRHHNEEADELRAISPSIATADGEEEEEDFDNDQQALLSATPSSRRQLEDANNAVEHSGSRPRTHVSNWSYMKEIISETMPTLLLSLVGTFLTGELLELLATWEAFKAIDELLVIVPMLLNLKGNLEMNLSARLGTAANMGQLDTRAVRRQLIFGNLSLLQVQALLVSCLAAGFAFLVSMLIPAGSPQSTDPESTGSLREEAAYALVRLMTRTRPPHHPPIQRPANPAGSGLHEFLIVLLIAQTAASLSSLILGSFMCSLVLLCRYFHLNPDNIAPAVASALGDLLTLSLLGISSHFLYPMSTFGLLSIQVGFVLSFCISFYMTFKNPRIKGLLSQGWSPLIGAMVISSGTGMILEGFVGKYKDYGLVSVAQDGIPGSVGSVYISRLSTALHEAVGHADHQRGDGYTHHPATAPQSARSRSWNLFTPKNDTTEVAIREARPKISGVALFLVTVPAQILFLVTAYVTGWLTLPAIWACGFVFFFSSAVVASLCLSHYLTVFVWNRDFDPDTYALPLQSALVDFIGQVFLVTCYELVGLITGDRVLEGNLKRQK